MSSLIHENCIFSVCRCTASVFFSLSVLAIQVFSLEMVCRCAVHGLQPLFMFATHAFLSKMVCRCTASVLLPLSVFAIQVFSLEMVCHCITSAFSLLSVLSIQGFLPEKVCRCTVHGLQPLFMYAIHAFLSKMVCRCIASVFFSFCQLRHMVLRPKWCVGEGAKDIGQIVNDAGRRVMNYE